MRLGVSSFICWETIGSTCSIHICKVSIEFRIPPTQHEYHNNWNLQNCINKIEAPSALWAMFAVIILWRWPLSGTLLCTTNIAFSTNMFDFRCRVARVAKRHIHTSGLSKWHLMKPISNRVIQRSSYTWSFDSSDCCQLHVQRACMPMTLSCIMYVCARRLHPCDLTRVNLCCTCGLTRAI